MGLNLDVIETAIKQIEVLEEQRIEAGWGQYAQDYTNDGQYAQDYTNDGSPEDNKQAWYQGTWRTVGRCGTAMCLAGWICDLDCGEWVGDTPYLLGRQGEGRREIPAMYRAINVTGIDDREADYLFSINTTIDMMKDWLEIKKANPDMIIVPNSIIL